MPIYEYGCRKCGHTIDALQKINDEPLVDCPECGEAALKRLISAPRFRLKGEGWYETDFKKDNQRNLAKGDSDGDATAKSDKSDKSEKAGKSDQAGKGGAGKTDGGKSGEKTESGRKTSGSSAAAAAD